MLRPVASNTARAEVGGRDEPLGVPLEVGARGLPERAVAQLGVQHVQQPGPLLVDVVRALERELRAPVLGDRQRGERACREVALAVALEPGLEAPRAGDVALEQELEVGRPGLVQPEVAPAQAGRRGRRTTGARARARRAAAGLPSRSSASAASTTM